MTGYLYLVHNNYVGTFLEQNNSLKAAHHIYMYMSHGSATGFEEDRSASDHVHEEV